MPMTDSKLKAYIESRPCGTGDYKSCESCIAASLCYKYVEKGLKNKSYSELIQNEPQRTIFQLEKNGDWLFTVDDTELTSGCTLQVLISDDNGNPVWTDTTVIYDGTQYSCNAYKLSGLDDYNPIGLFVRNVNSQPTITTDTGIALNPGKPLECELNGLTAQECGCDECDYLAECAASDQWEQLQDLTRLLDTGSAADQ